MTTDEFLRERGQALRDFFFARFGPRTKRILCARLKRTGLPKFLVVSWKTPSYIVPSSRVLARLEPFAISLGYVPKVFNPLQAYERKSAERLNNIVKQFSDQAFALLGRPTWSVCVSTLKHKTRHKRAHCDVLPLYLLDEVRIQYPVRQNLDQDLSPTALLDQPVVPGPPTGDEPAPQSSLTPPSAEIKPTREEKVFKRSEPDPNESVPPVVEPGPKPDVRVRPGIYARRAKLLVDLLANDHNATLDSRLHALARIQRHCEGIIQHHDLEQKLADGKLT